ncbi:type 4 pilus major pilin [Hydrogenophaga sp. NFH-34]|uniref:type 4 pilus major pilin n=1 Tax=Hydrogenophaga sp. NFH-34 TaxID=2744446 RepID=UPI001F45E9EB|nr:type 4 pilus major pilin [Hydrogenophaga sp. NFH-34]
MTKNIFDLSRAVQARALSSRARLKSAKGLKQSGFMSIELGLVLLAVAALIAFAVLYYRENQRKNSVNSNHSDIIAISGNLVSKYGQLNRYGDVTTELAVKSGVIPAHLRDPGADTAQNRFGGVIEVAPVDLTGTSDGISITWPNVSANQCSDIVSASEGEFRVITVDGSEIKGDGGAIDITALEEACDTDAPVELVFTAGRF